MANQKGDILIYKDNHYNEVKSVGVSGQVLTADPSDDQGMSWQDHNHDAEYLAIDGKADDSTLLNGVSDDTASTINTIVKRDGNADVYARIYDSSYASQSELEPIKVYCSNDTFIRSMPVSGFGDALGPYMTGVLAANVPVVDINDYFVGSDVEAVLADIGETRPTNGFDLLTPTSMGDISFVDGTRKFTIDVQGGQSNYYFWVDGKKVIKTAQEFVIIPDVTVVGGYYIYFDTSGVLQYIDQYSLTLDMFYKYALVAHVYWNALAGESLAGDERHGNRMSSITHHYNHVTYGARYEHGLGIEGLAEGEDDYTQTTSGSFWDEDINLLISAQATHKFLYRTGANGDWVTTSASNKIGYKDGGDTYYSWNEDTGSTWQLTEGGSQTDFFITFFVTTNNTLSGAPVYKIIGQNAYPNKGSARAAIDTELDNLKTDGLHTPEFVFMAALIIKRNENLQTLDDGSLYLDLRDTRGAGSAGTSDITTTAADVPVTTTSFDGILSVADSDVQSALDTLDDHDHEGSVLKRIELTSAGGQNINPTATRITWDNSIFKDSDVFTHSTSTNNHTITVLEDGVYDIRATTLFDNTGAARITMRMHLRINTTDLPNTYDSRYSRGVTYGQYMSNKCTQLVTLSAGDTIDVYVAISQADQADAVTSAGLGYTSLNIALVSTTSVTNTWRPAVTKTEIDALNVDADTLDGVSSGSFLRADAADIKTSGVLTFNDNIACNFGTGQDIEMICNGSNFYTDINNGMNWYLRDGNSANATRFTFDIDTGRLTCAYFTGTLTGSASLLNGVASQETATGNTIVRRHSSGYVYASYFNTTAAVTTTKATNVIMEYGDNFMRKQNPVNFFAANYGTVTFGNAASTTYIKGGGSTISVYAGNAIVGNGTYSAYVGGNYWRPGGDVTMYLGTSNRRWITVYASNAAINTSDEREKDFTKGVDSHFIYDLEPITYTWKGNDREIRHFDPKVDEKQVRYGFSAQQTLEVMPDKNAALVNQENPDSLGMSPTELIAPMVQCIQDLRKELDVLKQEVKELRESR